MIVDIRLLSASMVVTNLSFAQSFFISEEVPFLLSKRLSRRFHSLEESVSQRIGIGINFSRLSASSSGIEELPVRNNANIFVIDPGTTLEDLLTPKGPDVDHLETHVRQAATETWNWSAHFVVPHSLCPWAAASVRHSNTSIQIFLVRDPSQFGSGQTTEELFERALNLASEAFLRHLQGNVRPDPNKAIAFVVQCPPSLSSSTWDFNSFYGWYLDAEEDMLNQVIPSETENDDDKTTELLSDAITWAPFHPDWKYAGDSSLDLEKRTPYPTVSIVSTAVIDKAGPAATKQIGEQNEEILSSKTLEEWQQIYRKAVFETYSGDYSWE